MVGKVDCVDVVFEQTECPDKWNIVVPKDTEDGAYSVYVIAKNGTGLTDSWAGWLYIFDSRPICLNLECDNGQRICSRFTSPGLSESSIDKICMKLKKYGDCK